MHAAKPAKIIYLHVAYIRWDEQVGDKAMLARRLRLVYNSGAM